MEKQPKPESEGEVPAKGDSSLKTVKSSPPQLKALLRKALQSANAAVDFDNSKSIVQAQLAYLDACQLLEQALLWMVGPEERRKLEAINKSYQSRIEELGGILIEARKGNSLENFPAYPLHPVGTPLVSVLDLPGVAPSSTEVAESIAESSSFDRDGNGSYRYPTTVATSWQETKGATESLEQHAAMVLDHGGQRSSLALEPEVEARMSVSIDGRNDEVEVPVNLRAADEVSDVETAYSVASKADPERMLYLEAFSRHLSRDLGHALNIAQAPRLDPNHLEGVLKKFAWKLHHESSNPFQWEASVTLHRMRGKIVKLITGSSVDPSVNEDSTSDTVSSDDDGHPQMSIQKSRDAIVDWLMGVISTPESEEESQEATSVVPSGDGAQSNDLLVAQTREYEQFLQSSHAYRWLLHEMLRESKLARTNSSAMSAIGTKIQQHFRRHKSLLKMSRRAPSPVVIMAFHLDWSPRSALLDNGLDADEPGILEKVLCLTGARPKAQALTVVEYMAQTWPETWRPLLGLTEKLVAAPNGVECSYQVLDPAVTTGRFLSTGTLPRKNIRELRARVDGQSSCTVWANGDQYFVSETSEQLGWLASALRCSQASGFNPCSLTTYTPTVEDLEVSSASDEAEKHTISGSCRIAIHSGMQVGEDLSNLGEGMCWWPLFWNPILVGGYPILSRPSGIGGLEMSLHVMAFLVRSQQVVQWGDRIIMKGFNTLAIATLATTELVTWHLLVSASPEERVSYFGEVIDDMDLKPASGLVLRDLEGRRHILGWCAKAIEMCGHPLASLDVKSSGLRTPPSSIVIDRLYIEGGADLVVGLNMSINKKEKPFWLDRDNDYPSLLKWISMQPIILYDVSDRRAWLVDGASALLHLVRVSLHLDQNDTESTYDWVFDPSQLKEKWGSTTGRQSAIQTLKNWDNLNLPLYVSSQRLQEDGKTVKQYATLEGRVKKILHSIEVLVDKQAIMASQDGVKIPQTLDLRRAIGGFDILDIIAPMGPIKPRAQQFSRGHGWADLALAVGITTIFGDCFGDLIMADEPSTMCAEWRSVPKAMDYMAASASTVKMLHERRLTRMESGLGVGGMTKKIVWLSASGEPLQSCQCGQQQEGGGGCGDTHFNPAQFLLARNSWRQAFSSQPMQLVDISSLDGKGAVVFGHAPLLLGRRGFKDKGKGKAETQEDQTPEQLSETSRALNLPLLQDRASTLSPSASASTTSSSLGPTSSTLTVPSTSSAPSSSSTSGVQKQDDSDKAHISATGDRSKRPSRWTKWMRK